MPTVDIHMNQVNLILLENLPTHTFGVLCIRLDLRDSG